MSQRVTELLPELLALPEADRAELAHRLFDSLGDGEDADPDPVYSDPEVEAAWADEIAQRLDDVRSGRVTPIPWEEVHRRLLAANSGSDDGDDAG